ncbi:uncharacterized protein CLUP02_05473 [Colletotrichum lupini]|uniref:Uncharacterized protein n=1 Tax=Colletotrichum lupini TaxID=145971 RepID=A0A9Q8SMA9_9PEZI|nr:uncharacterized protein CLUP02_05473 [Colletotrichum lupini]UQC79992.1 hypothetical protein CLUP02_05473 [Colletotrichum lupini]
MIPRSPVPSFKKHAQTHPARADCHLRLGSRLGRAGDSHAPCTAPTTHIASSAREKNETGWTLPYHPVFALWISPGGSPGNSVKPWRVNILKQGPVVRWKVNPRAHTRRNATTYMETWGKDPRELGRDGI